MSLARKVELRSAHLPVDIRVECCVATPTLTAELISHPKSKPIEKVREESGHVLVMQMLNQCSPYATFQLNSIHDRFQKLGRVFAIPAHRPMKVRGNGGSGRFVRCLVTPERFFEITGYDFRPTDPFVLASCLDLRNTTVENLMTQLGRELRAPGLASAALVEALGISAIIELARYIKIPQPTKGGLSSWQLRVIRDYIQNAESTPTLSELCTVTGISMRHLTRAFKQTTGTTAYGYIEQVRFEKAKMLLADHNIPIQEISLRLGFAAPNSFTAAFKKVAGETPQAYRTNLRQFY